MNNIRQSDRSGIDKAQKVAELEAQKRLEPQLRVSRKCFPLPISLASYTTEPGFDIRKHQLLGTSEFVCFVVATSSVYIEFETTRPYCYLTNSFGPVHCHLWYPQDVADYHYRKHCKSYAWNPISRSKHLKKQVIASTLVRGIRSRWQNQILMSLLAWRGLGFSVAAELSNTVLGAVNGAIDIAKAAPNVAIEGARAVGNLGSFGAAASANNSAPPAPQAQDGTPQPTSKPALFPDANDIGFQKAYIIDSLVSDLRAAVDGDLAQTLRDKQDDNKLWQCQAELKQCQTELKQGKSKAAPSQEALNIVNECIEVSRRILGHYKAEAKDCCRSLTTSLKTTARPPISVAKNGHS